MMNRDIPDHVRELGMKVSEEVTEKLAKGKSTEELRFIAVVSDIVVAFVYGTDSKSDRAIELLREIADSLEVTAKAARDQRRIDFHGRR